MPRKKKKTKREKTKKRRSRSSHHYDDEHVYKNEERGSPERGSYPQALAPMSKNLRSAPPPDVIMRPSSALGQPRVHVSITLALHVKMASKLEYRLVIY